MTFFLVMCHNIRIFNFTCIVYLSAPNLPTADSQMYRQRRFYFGIGEGCLDFPPEESLPLDSNGAFLNGGLTNLLTKHLIIRFIAFKHFVYCDF